MREKKLPKRNLLCALTCAAICLSTTVGCSDAGEAQPRPSYSPGSVWTPAVKIDYPQPMTEAEKLAARLTSLRHRYEDAGLKGWAPPPEEIPLEKWESDNKDFIACLKAGGWPVDERGGISYDEADPNKNAILGAAYVCSARFSSDPTADQHPTPDQYGLIWDYFVEWQIPCLNSFGIHTAEPPSRDTYIALEEGGGFWLPTYTEDGPVASGVSQEVHNKAEAACPQNPPLEALWGPDA